MTEPLISNKISENTRSDRGRQGVFIRTRFFRANSVKDHDLNELMSTLPEAASTQVSVFTVN